MQGPKHGDVDALALDGPHVPGIVSDDTAWSLRVSSESLVKPQKRHQKPPSNPPPPKKRLLTQQITSCDRTTSRRRSSLRRLTGS